MMKQGLALVAALGLAACETGTSRSFDDPAVQQLYTMSVPEYYAALTLAQRVAQGCDRYVYDSALDADLNDARNEMGRGSLSALGLRNAIELETDVARRSFEVKHNVNVRTDNLCNAGDAETLEGTALSAMLVPV
ncbi:hypothetical protein [Yoonia litorea]|uniref:Lipoprotein n=1 Tax=Yoonia litorea TaxID=1123755 RepID=A0A1I6LTK8_9RHOB|nr:hypothetical protein [Yoonia litorea]SFS06746.1 hypothetical protein SAMN05444714_0880 [Yoonia litorea]